MNPQLNKKVKKYLDSYFRDTKANSPEHQEAVMLILKGALTDANFHSEAKQLGKYFPKASKKYIGTPMEGVIEDKGVDIAKMAKWDGHDIIDAFAFYLSMSIGGSFGNRLMSLKESIEESLVEEGEKLDEKNVPTNPSKWSYYKAQAKKKFDVYPSAYANGWAAKQYKKAGGGWKSESVNEAYIVTYAKKKGEKPASAAFQLRGSALSFEKDLKKDGYITMVTQKKVKGIDESLNEAKDMAFVDYLKVLDDKFLDGMKAVRGDNGSDAQIKPTRGDILQNFTLFRNYLSALTKKYKGDKTKLRFLTERANRLNEIIKSVNEAASRTAMEIGGLTGLNKDAIQKFVDDNKLDIEKLYQFVKKGKLADRIKLVSAIAGKPNNPVQKKMVKQFGESINEAQKKLPKFKNIPSWAKYVAQHSDGEWFFYEETPTMIRFKSGGGAWKQDGNQTYTGVKTDGKDWDKAPTYYNVKNGKITESVNEKMVAPQRGHSYYRLSKDTPIKYISGHSGIGLTVPRVLLHNEYDIIKGKKGAYIIDYFGQHFYVDIKNKFASKIAHPDNREQNKDLMKNTEQVYAAPDHSDWKKFMNESINELLAIVDKFDEKRQSYGKIYYRDGGSKPGDGDINKAKSELAKLRLNPKRKDLTLISVGRNSKMYDVMGESVNESQLKEFKHKVGSETIQFKVSPYRTGISLIAASGNDLDKLQDVMGSEDEVKGEIRKSLEKKLRIPIEIDRGYEGAGFGFKIDLYSLAKMVK